MLALREFGRRDSLPLLAMSPDVITGIFTLGGAAVGSAGSQVGGILRTTDKRRARREKRDAAATAARHANWQPIYERLTNAMNAMVLILNELKSAIEGGTLQRALQSYRTALPEPSDELYNAAREVQIHGSPAASSIGKRTAEAILAFGWLPDDGWKDLARVTEIRELLQSGQEEMFHVSRTDYGGDSR